MAHPWLVRQLLICVVAFGGWRTVYAQAKAAPAPTTGVNATAAPLHPATEDQIREYLAIVRVDKLAHEMMDSSVTAMQTTSAPYFPASFWDDMRAEMRKIDLVSTYVTVYQRYLSEEQMQAVIGFYRSSAGKTLLNVQPLAIRDAQQIMKVKGQAIGESVYERHKSEIEAAKKKFEQNQTAVPPGK